MKQMASNILEELTKTEENTSQGPNIVKVQVHLLNDDNDLRTAVTKFYLNWKIEEYFADL